MYEDVIELVGKENGPTSIILAGVHGNEQCGIDALQELLPFLEIQKGRVLVAYGNPRAIETDVRFIEANLNRLFRDEEALSEKERTSYEFSRAQFLKTYLNQADHLLDIHASLTPNSQRFLICEENSVEVTKYLPIPLIVSGFDKIEPGGTDYYMNQRGKIGICIECGYYKNLSSREIAKETVISFLAVCGHIQGTIKEHHQTHISITSLYRTKNNFTLAREFEDFEEIAEGEIVGKDGTSEIRMPTSGVILFARNRNAPEEEAFLCGRTK